MIAEIANGARLCGRCNRELRAGEPVYLVTRQKLARCEGCAREIIVGPLPCPLVTPKFAIEPEMTAERFDRQGMRQALWNRVQKHDHSARQVGSE